MSTFMSFLSLLAFCASQIRQAQGWKTFNTIKFMTPPSSKGFIGLEGDMIIPPITKAGTYYLWPGLQPKDDYGVYQDVLDGSKGAWWIGPGWFSEDPLARRPWGKGLPVTPGDKVNFFNTAHNATTWTSQIMRYKPRNYLEGSPWTDLNIGNYTFNQALFAIELGNVEWDFGPLTFVNVTMTALGSDTSWCAPQKAGDGLTHYTFSGVNATVKQNRGVRQMLDPHMTICTIENLTLVSPIGPQPRLPDS